MMIVDWLLDVVSLLTREKPHCCSINEHKSTIVLCVRFFHHCLQHIHFRFSAFYSLHSNAHIVSVKKYFSFLLFYQIPRVSLDSLFERENITKKNVAKAIYLLEYKFLCSIPSVQALLLTIYFCIRKIFISESHFCCVLAHGSSSSNS
jgi:hypothetical protein